MDRERYYRFSRYLRERYGCYVYKVGIDAGFSCPNRDGKLSREGCIFCDNRAFCFNSRFPGKSLEEQIREGMIFGRKRYGAKKFIVYFQAYTNTYASIKSLKKKYDIVKNFKDVVGIAIGTRPDCIDNDILDLIESYSMDYEVWIEYGVQSIHEKTLKIINRNHTYEDFLRAVELTKGRDIKICVHVIIGLPKEGEKEILETAKEIGKLNLEGIKIHPLHIIKGTKLEGIYKKGEYEPLKMEEYVELVIKFLEYLPPDTIIQRITADCPPEFLIAPLWILKKREVLTKIEEKLEEKNTYQGRLYKREKG